MCLVVVVFFSMKGEEKLEWDAFPIEIETQQKQFQFFFFLTFCILARWFKKLVLLFLESRNIVLIL